MSISTLVPRDSCGPVPGAWAAMALTLSFVASSYTGPTNVPEWRLVQ